jgi:hypothetical protein
VVLGALASLLDFMDSEIVLESVLHIIPKFHDRNREAFQIGYELMEKAR